MYFSSAANNTRFCLMSHIVDIKIVLRDTCSCVRMPSDFEIRYARRCLESRLREVHRHSIFLWTVLGSYHSRDSDCPTKRLSTESWSIVCARVCILLWSVEVYRYNLDIEEQTARRIEFQSPKMVPIEFMIRRIISTQW